MRWTTFRSARDEQIGPTSSTGPAGAADLRTGCLTHDRLLTDPTVATRVREALAS
ncbi:hypothetical protein ACWDRR_21900 [Kitasatospora sp. NPDC003701]